jgi:ParB family chromosome partitioning protein
MELLDVPIDSIVVPEVRITNAMDPEMAAEFASAIRVGGVLEPILVYRDSGRLVLVDGLHRLLEAQAAGATTITAAVRDGTLEQVLVANLLTSVARGKPRHSDVRRLVRALEEDLGWDMVRIRQLSGLSQYYVETLAWANRALPVVQQALDDELITPGHAEALARVEWPDVQERLLEQQIEYRWPVPVLRRQIALVRQVRAAGIEPAAPNAPRPPALARCRGCRRDYPPEDVLSLILCPGCLDLALSATHSRQPPPAPPDST